MDERFRLDKLLSMAGMTRSEARRAIASGRAQVAGQVAVSYTHLDVYKRQG